MFIRLILLAFIAFHIFLATFPRVAFTRIVNPSDNQVVSVRFLAILMVFLGLVITYVI